MGISNTGYRLKTAGDYLETILADMNKEFPNMSNASNNLAVIIARQLAAALEENDNTRAEGYNNAYVSTATGAHLDKAVSIAGISRIDGTRSYGKALFKKEENSPDVFIAPDTLLESDGIRYYTTNINFVSVNSASGVEIEIASVDKGENINLAKLSKLTPVINIRGIKEITCPLGTTGGTNTETDQELRSRYYSVISSYKNTSLKGIISQVRLMPDVLRVDGKENYKDIADGGLPPHSFALFVEGASDNDIANKIFEVKPAGINTHGTITELVEFNGVEYPISFSRFSKQTIYYSIGVKPNTGIASSTLEDDIKKAIIDFTNMTQVVNHSELVGYLFNHVEGIGSFKKIAFGLTPNPTTDDEINLDVGKIFMTDNSKIDVAFVGGA